MSLRDTVDFCFGYPPVELAGYCQRSLRDLWSWPVLRSSIVQCHAKIDRSFFTRAKVTSGLDWATRPFFLRRISRTWWSVPPIAGFPLALLCGPNPHLDEVFLRSYSGPRSSPRMFAH